MSDRIAFLNELDHPQVGFSLDTGHELDGAGENPVARLGGANAIIEGNIMARLYREAPINSIWEGSGNVMCLDVLRAMGREPESVTAFLGELELAGGANTHFDRALSKLKDELHNTDDLETRARRIAESLAITLQASLLIQHAPAAVSDAFCASRLGGQWGREYGTLTNDCDFDSIIDRAAPQMG